MLMTVTEWHVTACCLLSQMLITADQGGDGLARFSDNVWERYRSVVG